MNYYNEFDPFAAEWLKALIKQGLIPDGEVDTRSIVDVRPDDLRPFKQCHFFAGIGGWSHALRLAGWDDDRQIWTGSCPCQPFSVAGKGKGQSDERHLWPAFFELIRQVRPPVVMGEQVAGKAGYGWFDGVASDLEGEGYSSRAVDIPACAVNAPHIRQRLYWVGSLLENTSCNGCIERRQAKGFEIQGKCSERRRQLAPSRTDGELPWRAEGFCGASLYRPEYAQQDSWWERENAPQHSERINMVKSDGSGQREYGRPIPVRQEQPGVECSGRDAYPVADPDQSQRGWWAEYGERFAYGEATGREQGDGFSSGCGGVGFWDDAEWATGSDGKARRLKPGVRLLVNGVPNRVGRLRGYGNAIVPPLAAEVIRAFMETEG